MEPMQATVLSEFGDVTVETGWAFPVVIKQGGSIICLEPQTARIVIDLLRTAQSIASYAATEKRLAAEESSRGDPAKCAQAEPAAVEAK